MSSLFTNRAMQFRYRLDKVMERQDALTEDGCPEWRTGRSCRTRSFRASFGPVNGHLTALDAILSGKSLQSGLSAS